MTDKQPVHRPTDGELAILRVLWRRGPSSVREVHESMEDGRTTGYTTSLKMMQIMLEKGLLRRQETGRSHVYEAAVPAEVMERRLVDDLIERAFAGQAQRLVMHALASEKATPEELAEIRRLIDSIEEAGGDKPRRNGKRGG